MAIIKKKAIGKQIYYYLEHSIKKNNRIIKKELYLGKEIPSNIYEIKTNFLRQIYAEKWFYGVEQIKNGYLKDYKNTPKSAKDEELKKFAIKFTYDSQRIEGSTLSLRETSDLLDKLISPRNKPIADVKEAEAHNNLFYEVINYDKNLTLAAALYFHKKLFHDTRPDIAGMTRKHQVMIARSKFIPPLPAELDHLLHEFFKWYNINKKRLNPVELAALVHLKFVTIHPFSDGNGRISRLMMNFVLNEHRYPMFNIEYINRNSYYNALERSQINKNDFIFLNWFMRNYIKENKRYMK
ncbi:MAG: Fic family protein [Nanoarchaeota archaeon]